MDTARTGSPAGASRFDGLHAEAKGAVGYAANTLRTVRERYREAYLEELARWHGSRDEVERADRERESGRTDAQPPAGPGHGEPAPGDGGVLTMRDAAAAEADAADEAGVAHFRDLRIELDRLTGDLGMHQQELSRLEVAHQALERTWRFLERGDASLLADPSDPGLSSDLRMRIVEAQEAERSRLAQEVHDGPAQALTNAIFQVEYLERVVDQDGRLAQTELRFLRELLRRELGEVRSFISQLRPPLLDHVGLDEGIRDAAATMSTLTGLPIETDLQAPGDRLDPAARTVALRVVQEALQNVRKHASASTVAVRTRLADGDWELEITDDGRGFEPTAVAIAGGRHFGLQFMRERAELVGARFDVRSRPGGGTVVRLAVPLGGERR